MQRTYVSQPIKPAEILQDRERKLMRLDGNHAASLAHGTRKRQRIFTPTRSDVDDDIPSLRTIMPQPVLFCVCSILLHLLFPRREFRVKVVEPQTIRYEMRSNSSCP